jgi:predicted GNAT family acetyltransferase
LLEGVPTLALLVDSFAVRNAHRKKGIAGRMFETCVAQLHRRVARGLVFAQCVKTAPACHLWYNRLDDTAVARGLMLQAVRLSPFVVAQVDGCVPRAREFTRKMA